MHRLIALLAVSVVLSACGPFQPNHDDKAACLTIDDLNELGLGAEVDRAKEKWFGIQGIGTKELLYDYQHSVRGGRGRVMIHCQATQQRTGLEAMVTYRMSLATAKAVALSDVDEKRLATDGCKDTDACLLIGFYLREQPVGSHFAIRVGSQVVAATVIGSAFDDVAEWRGFVAKKVDAMKSSERASHAE
jgi:hypothetical protein